MALKTDYTDFIPPAGGRVYQLTTVDAVTQKYNIADVTEYTQEGSAFGAVDITATNAKVNALSAGLVYSTTEVETGEVGPTGKKWYRRDYTGTLPTITTDAGLVEITLTGVTKGIRVEAGTWNASKEWQPVGYAFYLTSPQNVLWSSFCLHSAGALAFRYGRNLGGLTYGIHFTYEK